MKSFSKIKLMVVFLLVLMPGIVAGRASDTKLLIDRDRDYLEVVRSFPKSWRVEAIPGQSFVSDQDGTVFAAGVAYSEDLPGKSDCFIYTRKKGQQGTVTFVSERAEDIWYCIGSPALTLREYANESSSVSVVLGIFEYQAPSGERFNFPFILDSYDSSRFKVGKINDCAVRNLRGSELRRIDQLDGLIQKCTGMKRDRKK